MISMSGAALSMSCTRPLLMGRSCPNGNHALTTLSTWALPPCTPAQCHCCSALVLVPSVTLFVLLRKMTADKVLDRLKSFHMRGRVLQTSLSQEDEARLRDALSGTVPPAPPAPPAGA